MRTADSPVPVDHQAPARSPRRTRCPASTVLIGPHGHAGRDQVVEPVGGGPAAKPLDQQRPELVPVGGAPVVAGEPRVVGKLGRAEHLAQLAELRVVARGHDELAVARSAAARTGTGWDGSCPSGTAPRRPATYALVWFTMPDIAEAIRLASTCWPSPVAARWCSAARMPIAVCRPAITSNSEMPGAVRRPVRRHRSGSSARTSPAP